MIDLSSYQQSIEQAISELKLPLKPGNLYDPLRYFMHIGGKRMRPILTLMACELFGAPTKKAMNAALAVEIFHNFSLIHDDIMDAAPIRRGQETVHKKWNENIAILSGDVLLVKAYEHISNYESEIAHPLLKLFSRTAVEVCEGQQYDMDYEIESQVSITDYLNMIKNKTAVLLGCSLEMGAIVAGASKNDRNALYEFGVNLGLAFQLQDDILDVYADQSKFGKQVGGDIIANKKTYLMLKAIQDADVDQRERLEMLFSETDIAKKVSGVMAIYDELNIKAKSEEQLEKYYQIALDNLNQISASPSQKGPLTALSHFLMNRQS